MKIFVVSRSILWQYDLKAFVLFRAYGKTSITIHFKPLKKPA